MLTEYGVPEQTHPASPYLFRVEGGSITSYTQDASNRVRERARVLNETFTTFVKQKDYPCIAARSAVANHQHRIGIYGELGSGKFARELCADLATFRAEQHRTRSHLLTLVATYEGSFFADEKEFEEALWRELSAVTSVPEYAAPGDPLFSDDPADPNFCFSFQGNAFFVVGMHPGSSRVSRRFAVPSLVFNLYSQFEELDEETEFYPMVETNRKRDRSFQGSVNPMVEQYAEKWESIQFSGRENPPEWKCPFKRLLAKGGFLS